MMIKKKNNKNSIALSILIICSLLISILPLFITNVTAQVDWRTEAQYNIDTYRKSDLTIHVSNSQGNPISGATVQVEMQKHQFILGTAIALDVFQSNQQYRDKMLDLDGQGHGFTGGVMENAMKWQYFNGAGSADVISWCKQNGMEFRGHNLIWPAFQTLPSDIESNQNNPDYVRQRMDEHVAEAAGWSGIRGEVRDWDVINEPVHCTDIRDIFQGSSSQYPTGEEIYPEIFQWAAQADPNAKLYYNEYNIVSGGYSNTGTHNEYKKLIQDINNRGLLDGIGIQGHMGTSRTSPQDVMSILNDFAQFDKEMLISEYDCAGLSGTEEYDFTRDFLTVVFAQPLMRSFYVWGFWDGRHWLDDAAFFTQDWSLKPAGQAIIDLMFNEWWTDVSGTTNSNGDYTVPDGAFNGEYKITVSQAGQTIEETFNLAQDMTVNVVLPVGPVDPDPPSTPTGLSASAISSSQINLDWNDNTESDLANYRVYRSTSATGTYSYIGQTSSSSYSSTGLSSESTYYYRVSAVDTSGNESPQSSYAGATTLPGGGTATLKAQYRSANTATTTQDIRAQIQILNDGSENVALNDITVRYWFTSEPALNDLTYSCDYAAVGSSGITSSFGTAGDSDYLEIGFTSSATVPTWLGGDGSSNSLPIGANTGDIQNRIGRNSNVDFIQSNDHSFDASMSDYTDNSQITVYYQNNLVWGVEPPNGPINNPPSISSPADITYIIGDTGFSIDWTAIDEDPATYIITRNGSQIDSGTWSPNFPISINIDGLAMDTYIYECIVTDQIGQSNSDLVVVTVTHAAQWQLGDVNHDETIDIIDALLVAQYYVGEDPQPFYSEQADVNEDGAINIVDALLISQYYVGQIPSLPPS
ncbi:MAG: endo-1,4-beta-xylanase [Candidatus Lokiarchaeota archaeon]|nr:endo-1,4-beta-xylanase [Candidatus Lokiarchaeota archaeon]